MADPDDLGRELRARDAERRTVRDGLSEIRDDVERIGASRAWRWGHAAAALAGRVLRRPARTQGGVEQALERIDRLQHVLSAPQPDPRMSSGPPSFCLKLTAASRDSAHLGGDFHFAAALARELERRGHRTRVQVLPEEETARDDEEIVVVLRGRTRHTPRATQRNVLWVISHPTEVTAEECDGYDLVAVASESYAASLRERTSSPVIVLEQATDPEFFHPDSAPGHEHELLFVGNARGERRRILDDLLPTAHELAVYGGGWDGLVDARHLAGPHVPNKELRRLYSGAAIVLSDHWPDMREHGFVSNRVYDAVACGAFVISDAVEGIEERFGGAVRTYETREQLAQLVELYLADPAERQVRAAAGRRRVLAEHTFAHRVDALLQALEAGLGRPSRS